MMILFLLSACVDGNQLAITNGTAAPWADRFGGNGIATVEGDGGGRRLSVACGATTSVSDFAGLKNGIAAVGGGEAGCFDIGAAEITFTETIDIGSYQCTSCPSIKISGATGAVLSGGGATGLFENYGTLQLEGPMTIRDGYTSGVS